MYKILWNLARYNFIFVGSTAIAFDIRDPQDNAKWKACAFIQMEFSAWLKDVDSFIDLHTTQMKMIWGNIHQVINITFKSREYISWDPLGCMSITEIKEGLIWRAPKLDNWVNQN